jgi:hypothetical protein
VGIVLGALSGGPISTERVSRRESMTVETPAEKLKSYDPPQLEQIKLLYDYTKFHIGLYITLLSAIATAFALTLPTRRYLYLLSFIVIAGLLIRAGLAAGYIATGLLDIHQPYLLWKSREGSQEPEDFRDLRTRQKRTLREWINIEHRSFWWAVGIAMGSLLAIGTVEFILGPITAALP